MKKPVKYTLYVLGVIVLTLLSVFIYLSTFLPNVGPPPDITVEITEEKVARGEYLANHVMLCMDCHAQRDFTIFTGPIIPGTHGAGGEVFDEKAGFPGSFVSRNLTPYRLGEWSDGEIFRAITAGVSRDGSALFPVMPYPMYSQLDESDIRAVIAYLRTLEPVENELPASKANFPVNLIMNTMPQKPNLQPRPPKSDIVNYGRYIITASACYDCHTKMEKGQFVGEPYAGGNEFQLPDGSIVRSPNLTPHESGIGNWTKDQFVDRFKMFADTNYVPHKVNPGDFQTIMPWMYYARMDREDMEAIFEYLQSLPPVDNIVEVFTPPN